MKCIHCASEKIFARGMCQKHYTQLRRNGEIGRTHAINGGQCTYSGCATKAIAKGLCGKHYQQGRHPLEMIWRNLRSRSSGIYPKEWKKLDGFLADVGERPSDKHQLRRLDPTEPWSKVNFTWLAPIGVSATDRSYQRRWRAAKIYGLPPDWEDHKRAELNNTCPGCDQPFERLHPDTGKLVKTCIDHDHVTDEVRGLLCDDCNKALGNVKDSVPTLKRLIAYLEKANDKGKN